MSDELEFLVQKLDVALIGPAVTHQEPKLLGVSFFDELPSALDIGLYPGEQRDPQWRPSAFEVVIKQGLGPRIGDDRRRIDRCRVGGDCRSRFSKLFFAGMFVVAAFDKGAEDQNACDSYCG